MVRRLDIVVTPHIARHLESFHVSSSLYRIAHPQFDDDISSRPIVRCDRPVTIENASEAHNSALCIDDVSALRRSEADSNLRHFRTLSLMGGAGGMDVGLSQCDNKGYFRTHWAIEWSKTSVKTFKRHHPFTKVFEMDVGKALERRQSIVGMPKPGEVDVIIMGPPCQPFSSLNRAQNNVNHFDQRSLLVATGLSYVDVYRPTYGILENLCSMLTRGHLGTVQKDGIIKFIRNCLDTLGYNTRFCRVQSGHYGIPQSRSRVKILFARKDARLPRAPTPTTKLAGSASNEGGTGDAVTIKDATSDLPRWEYANPHRLYGRRASMKDARPRSSRPRKYSGAGTRKPIGPSVCRYASPPTNDFQRLVRSSQMYDDIDDDTFVSQHQTLPIDALTVERICNIPFRPSANHLSLLNGRNALALGHSIELTDPFAFENAYRRLDENHAFQIVTTSICLGSKLGRLLMPDQHRTPTMRELARAQGFPDRIHFAGTPAQVLRQIGNAVPVPLATAIGRSIRAAAIDDYLAGDCRFARQRQRTSTSSTSS